MASSLKTEDEGRKEHTNEGTSKKLRWATDVVEPATATGGNGNKAKNNDNQSAAVSNSTTGNGATSASSTFSSKAKALLCSICRQHPAAVVMKKSWERAAKNNSNEDKSGPQRQPLCLLHYYTTAAVHADPDHVKILDADLVEAQMKGGGKKTNTLNVQELFAEAFVQLQQELAQESLNITAAANGNNNHQAISNPRKAPREKDPLGILHDLGRSKKRRQVPVVNSNNNNNSVQKEAMEGGFLRPVPIPERLKKTQQQQAKIQAEQLARMNRAAAGGGGVGGNLKQPPVDNSKRRQPSRKSVWDAVIRDSKDTPAKKRSKNNNTASILNNIYHEVDVSVTGVKCSCGSKNVSSAGNITSRNQDLTKGETWGMKDRSDDIILRYRCNQCGKLWQESG